MKKSIKHIILFLLFTIISYSQKSIDKPPVFPPKKGIKKTEKLPRLFNYLNLTELNQLNDDLCCWKSDNDCHILDREKTLFTYY